jgi:hypothetical protein
MLGHARVLKKLLEAVTCSLLLIKPAPRAPFKLKVGEALQARSAPEEQARGAKQDRPPGPDNS